MSRSALMTKPPLAYRIDQYLQLTAASSSNSSDAPCGRFGAHSKLPESEGASDPIAGFHEQHCFLLSRKWLTAIGVTDCDFQPEVFEVEAPEPVTGNNQQEVIRARTMVDFPPETAHDFRRAQK